MNNSWQKIELFKELTKQELNLLGNFFVEKKYKNGDFVFHAKKLNDKLIIIIAGQTTLEASLENKTTNLAIFKKDDFVGELCLLKKDVYYQHSLKVSSAELITYELSNKNWYTIIKKNPKIKEKILGNLTFILHQRLEHADNKLVALFAIGQYLTGQHDLKEISSYILKTILEIIPSQQALLCSYSQTTDKIHIYHVKNYPLLEKVNHYSINKLPILKDIIKHPRTIIFCSRDLPQGSTLWPLSDKQSIITPILAGQKTIGFIALSSKAKGQEYSANNIILLEALANQLAGLIQNIRSQEWEEAEISLKKEYIDLPY
jgi:CRP-like cAMP-binding protein